MGGVITSVHLSCSGLLSKKRKKIVVFIASVFGIMGFVCRFCFLFVFLQWAIKQEKLLELSSP